MKPNTSTQITQIEPNHIVTRGIPQEELIESYSFAKTCYLLLKGKTPTDNEEKMLNSILVACCDHGITPPSTQVTRIITSSGAPLNSAIAGGISSFGKNHSGALENAMKLYQQHITTNKKYTQEEINEIAEEIIQEYTDKKIPGLGHRYHTNDPRATRILELAQKYNCQANNTLLALSLEDKMYQDKKIKLNIDGAAAAVLSDMGFHWKLGTGIFMIGRLPGLIAHSFEEYTSEEDFRKLINL